MVLSGAELHLGVASGGCFVDSGFAVAVSNANNYWCVDGGCFDGGGLCNALFGVGAGSGAYPPGGVWLAGAEPPGGVLCAGGFWGRLHGGGAFFVPIVRCTCGVTPWQPVGVGVGAAASWEHAGKLPVLFRFNCAAWARVGGLAVLAFILFSISATLSKTPVFRVAPHFVAGIVVVVVVVVAEVVAAVWWSVYSLWSLWLLWSSLACACSRGCSGVVVAVAVMLLAMSVEAPVQPVRGGASSSVMSK